MGKLNVIMNWIGGLFFGTVRDAGPWLAMVAVSVVSAVIVLAVFRLVSNRELIRRRKGRMIARLLELLLFRHDIVLSMGAFGRLLSANAAYLVSFLVPLAVCMIPLSLIMAQTGAWLDARPLEVGEMALLKVRFVPEAPVMRQTIDLEAGGAVTVVNVPVRIPDRNEICWTLHGTSSGFGRVTLTVDGVRYDKLVSCGTGMIPVSQRVVQGGAWAYLLNPAEPPLAPAGRVAAVSVEYPRSWLSDGLPGMRWLVVYTFLTLLFGGLLQKPFGVVM